MINVNLPRSWARPQVGVHETARAAGFFVRQACGTIHLVDQVLVVDEQQARAVGLPVHDVVKRLGDQSSS
jgi:hypothetical protein